eukprot:8584531-Pyramimonas_sp.AAC.1
MLGVPNMRGLCVSEVLRRAGHVARLSNDRLPKLALFSWRPDRAQSTHSARGTFITYRRTLAWALKERRVPLESWMFLAQDKGHWRKDTVRSTAGFSGGLATPPAAPA